AWCGLWCIVAGEGQPDEAVRCGRQAIARQPKRAGFRVVLADILWQGGRREEALGAIEEGERLAPGVPIYPYLRATKLAQMGRAADAVAALEQGHRLQRAAGLPPAESDRYTALLDPSIDPPSPRASGPTACSAPPASPPPRATATPPSSMPRSTRPPRSRRGTGTSSR